MITFKNHINSKDYYFYELLDKFEEYKNIFNSFIENNDLSKEYNDIFTLVKKYKEKNNHNYTYELDFIKIITKTNTSVIIEQINNNIEEITIDDYKNFIIFTIQQEKFFNSNKDDSKNTTKIIKCFLELHSHISKYVDSSSALTLNNIKEENDDIYLNYVAKTKFGTNFSFNSGGGFSRDHSYISKLLLQYFQINNKRYCLAENISKILSKIKNNQENFDDIELFILEQFKDLKSLYENNIEIKQKNMKRISMLIYKEDDQYINMIPVTSEKMISLLLKMQKSLKDDYKYSKKIKSVASNPQNISELANAFQANIPRFYSNSIIKVPVSKAERRLYNIEKVFLNIKIKDSDIKSKYMELYKNEHLSFIPFNSKNNLKKSFLKELGFLIVKELNNFKKLVKKENIEEILEKETRANNILLLKYIKNEKMNENEIEKLSKIIILKYENIHELLKIEKIIESELLMTVQQDLQKGSK